MIIKRLNFYVLISLIIIVIIQPGIGLDLQAADLNNLEDVLEIYSDSRKIRDLKESANPVDKQAFMETLENEVYKPVDQVVVEELSQLPEYEGKRIITHDFRTPGDDGVNVNTDRDVRVLVEVEPDRWTEVPVNKWENTYYREFARRTGYQSVEDVETEVLQEHAARYRQLPTDKFHIEASRDFSDLDTLKVEGGEDYRVVSTPNVVKAQKGLNTLQDPEGLAYMYREKADEQYRQVRDIQNRLEERVKEGLISNKEIAELNDLKKMHEIEGTVQLKKGVETLDELRASYREMGYDTGRLSPEMQEAVRIVKNVKGTSDTDINNVRTELKRLGFQDMNDLNQKVRGQLESLKMARKYQKPRINIDSSLKTAGKWAGIAGDIMSIRDSLEKAEQGNHLLFNYEKDDSRTEKTAKTLAVAALELAPVPVIDAVERGWQVDEEEKQYLQNMSASGRAGTWETHPLTSIARVSTKITYRAVKSMTIDPLVAGKTAMNEGYRTLGDVSKNFLADFERSESERLQAEKRKEFEERSGNFGLVQLLGEKEDGRSLANGVKPGEILKFYTGRNENWTEEYRIKWELEISPGNSLTVKEIRADQTGSEMVKFEMPVMEPGEYILRLRVFDRNTNLQVDYRELPFTVSDEIGLTDMTATLADFNGPALNGEAEVGDILAFEVDRIGDWNEQYYVEWSLNGRRYKYEKADDPKIHLLRFTTDELTAGDYKVSVRILAADNKIIAYREYMVKLQGSSADFKLNDFNIRGSINNYGGEPLKRTIENGEILAFAAEIEHPVFKEQITPLTRLKWQVYDSSGRALPGLIKVDDIVESGTVRDYHFRFRPENLPNGDYYVELEQSLPTKSIENRACYDFKIYQPLRIDRVYVTADKGKEEDQQYFFIDQAPLFYVYYTLADNKPVDIRLKAAGADGRIIEDITVKRPREGETAPYRIGMGLKKNLFRTNDTVEFSVEISNESGYKETARKRIQFVDYELEIVVPERLRTGENGQFTIKVPPNFKAPYQVDINVGKGLGVGYQPGQLSGTISSIITGPARKVLLTAKVTDVSGATAQGSKEIIAEPRQASPGTPQLNRALVEAVDDGDLYRVKELLEKGASPNSKYDDYNTVLHYHPHDCGYIEDYVQILPLLLEYGGGVNRMGEDGTPLYYMTDAASFIYGLSGYSPAKIKEKQQQVIEAVKLLLEYGADVNLKKDNNHSPLWYAADEFNPRLLRILIGAGAVYEQGLLEWIAENKVRGAEAAAGSYSYDPNFNQAEFDETKYFVLDQFAEVERILRELKNK